ncbi:relaxase/mobilization nuclease domain-containing protein [Brevibacterium sp. SIMBA_078]|uniref:relaxase/mobilization nuclease domain-containing protein n=3 Tax=Bacteria TaxID=2 RepID=UPI00397B5CB3
MAIISCQTTRTSGRAQNYAKKDAVAISAVGASVQRFEQRLAEIRRAHGKDGLRPRAEVNEEGKPLRDDKGDYVVAKDGKGNTVYEAKYVEAYSLVQSFGHDELDPDDPESWTRANELGRAIAEDRFPGRPVLVATEINGRSGCVHNHIIVGAVHAETGKSIDSNLVTHARLAIEHDRVLAEQGFVQREDMRELVADAKRRMDEAREQVIAEHGAKISDSQLRRKITAAENRVTLTNGEDRALQQKQRPSAYQVREDRRQREFHRYELREQEREATLGIGATPPPERFSEIVLESRIRETLNDPRVQSWDDAAEIGRENGVTIKRRGRDVSYGMMLAQSDGALAEPARAHTRRGGVKDSGKGLGDGYRVADVEAAIARNAQLQRAADRQREDQTIAASVKARVARDDAAMQARFDADTHDALDRIQRGPVEDQQKPVDKVPETEPVCVVPEPTEPARPEPARFRSGLRGVKSKDGSEKIQQRIVGMAQLEEDYRGELPDAEYEARLNAFGIGPHFMRHYGEHLEPETRRQLTWRVQAKAASAAERQRGQEHAERGQRLREQYDHLRVDGERSDPHGWVQRQEVLEVHNRILASDSGIEKTNGRRKEIHGLVRDGRYEEAARAAERHQEQDRKTREAMENYSSGLDHDEEPSASDRFSARAKAAQERDRGSMSR